MNEHDIDIRLRSWARSANGRPAPDELRREVLDIPRREPTRPQRHRWPWSLPGSKPIKEATDEPDGGRRTAPTSKQDGQVPATIGGTTTMFSAAKMIGLAASLALVGVLALALPANLPEEPAPAAEAPTAAELTPFSGRLIVFSPDRLGDSVEHDWGVARMDQRWTFEFDFDDERLNGRGRSRVTDHVIDGSSGGPKSFTLYIENDGGSWVGTGRAYNGVNGGGWHHQTVLTGQGGYEGLAAILAADQTVESSVLEVQGVVFTGGLPALPEPAPMDFE